MGKGNNKNAPTSTSVLPNRQSTTVTNRPNNHLIRDATSPYDFEFVQFGTRHKITVDQTAEEETWPGGALWDVGVLMARLLVMMNSPRPVQASTTSDRPKSKDARNNKNSVNNQHLKQLSFVPRVHGICGTPASWKEKRVLELGCGVGLTGLVAGSLGSRAVLLTDLEIVIEKVTLPNVEKYKHIFGLTKLAKKSSGLSSGKVDAVPLCWGSEEDEVAAASFLDNMAPPFIKALDDSSTPKNKKKCKQKASRNCNHQYSNMTERAGIPDIVLIGDVAYQHKPGAPSHFDALLSTLLKFTDRHTIVIFGTRMRMPASRDLLEMFNNHFDEIITHVDAHEVDSSFSQESLGRKSNITIHFMKRKQIAPE